MKSDLFRLTTKSLLLAFVVSSVPLIFSSCVGPAGRSEVRQTKRVENRVDDRYDRRRGN